VEETKSCKGCKQIKNIADFYDCKNTRDKKTGKCKQCILNYVAGWQKVNPEKCRVKTNKYHIKIAYKGCSITVEEREELFIKQEGKCAMCGRHERAFKRRLAVDHCHKTGKIRGLLCGPCNRALGLLRDRIEVLQAGISYLCQSSPS
jgi:hypothetical protein